MDFTPALSVPVFHLHSVPRTSFVFEQMPSHEESSLQMDTFLKCFVGFGQCRDYNAWSDYPCDKILKPHRMSLR